jgi:hypothetical protein
MMFKIITVIAVAIALSVGAMAETAAAQPLRHPSTPQVSGTKLQAALLPPSAWGPENVNNSSLNSGSKLVETKKPVRVASVACGYYESRMFTGGFGNTAGADEHYTNPGWLSTWPFTDLDGDQDVMQFPTAAAAAAYFGQAEAKYKTCAPSGSSYDATTVSVLPATVSGYHAFAVTQTADVPDLDRYQLYRNSLYVLAGLDVFDVRIFTGNDDGPSMTATTDLIQQVLAVQRQG